MNSQTLCFMDFAPDKKNNNTISLVDKINHKISNKHIKGNFFQFEITFITFDIINWNIIFVNWIINWNYKESWKCLFRKDRHHRISLSTLARQSKVGHEINQVGGTNE